MDFPRRRAALSGALFVLGPLLVSACGGSSSETPPPLEPLPARLREEPQPTGSAAVPPAEGEAPSEALVEPSAPQPAAAPPEGTASPTWGR
jgi:hypothetical protein